MMIEALLIIGAYLVGSIPTGVIVGRMPGLIRARSARAISGRPTWRGQAAERGGDNLRGRPAARA